MSLPVVSAVVAAILIVIQQSLMFTVGMHRAKANIGMGFGEDMTLERKIRRHGNLAENAALFVVTLSLAELCGTPKGIVIVFGALFLLSRLFHILGFSSLVGSHMVKGNKIFFLMRALGAFGTLFVGIALGIFLIWTIIKI